MFVVLITSYYYYYYDIYYSYYLILYYYYTVYSRRSRNVEIIRQQLKNNNAPPTRPFFVSAVRILLPLLRCLLSPVSLSASASKHLGFSERGDSLDNNNGEDPTKPVIGGMVPRICEGNKKTWRTRKNVKYSPHVQGTLVPVQLVQRNHKNRHILYHHLAHANTTLPEGSLSPRQNKAT